MQPSRNESRNREIYMKTVFSLGLSGPLNSFDNLRKASAFEFVFFNHKAMTKERHERGAISTKS